MGHTSRSGIGNEYIAVFYSISHSLCQKLMSESQKIMSTAILFPAVSVSDVINNIALI